MCASLHGPTDADILGFLADHDFEGDITPGIAREVAADYLKAYPRSGKQTDHLVARFRGADGKVLPLNVYQRKLLADYIFAQPDSS